MHIWHDPFDRITALTKAKGVAITTPCMGEAPAGAQTACWLGLVADGGRVNRAAAFVL